MEIRQVVRGTDVGFAPKKAKTAESGTSARPAADRLELSRRWVEQMGEQSVRIQALLAQPADKKSNGILDMLDGPSAEEQELDALSKQMDVQMKCMKIAANIMKGKKVPPEDEQYLMENDPEGYKLAIAMRSMVKEDDEECKSVLKDEDKQNGEPSEMEESAPAEAPSDGGGEAAE